MGSGMGVRSFLLGAVYAQTAATGYQRRAVGATAESFEDGGSDGLSPLPQGLHGASSFRPTGELPCGPALPRPKRILVLFPGRWDRRHFSHPRYRGRFELLFHDEELWSFPGGLWRILRFHPVRYIDEVVRRFRRERIDGVLSTDEYVGNIFAHAVAERLGLPGSRPSAVIETCHKHYARRSQRAIVPDAVPAVQLMGVPPPRREEVRLRYPFFVKPVRGSFSIFSARIESYRALARHLALSLPWRLGLKAVLRPFNDLYRHYFPGAVDVNRFIAEELLPGRQVCVDGFVSSGQIRLLGVVDACFFRGTHAFERFQYPSTLPAEVQARMRVLARRLIAGLGLEHGPFNVELVYDEARDHINVLELHPRISYQFADLYEDVDGTNTYDLMLDLAVGREPVVREREGPHATSASLVIRKFHGRRLVRMPDDATLREFAERHPAARVELFAKPGSMNPEMRAMGSYRCALINVGGSHEEIAATRRDADRLLQFDVA
jgi:hypothetical protein